MHGRIPEASRITQKCVIASLLAIWLDEQIGRVGLQAEVAFFASAWHQMLERHGATGLVRRFNRFFSDWGLQRPPTQLSPRPRTSDMVRNCV
jgi:hypothetical protein